MKIQPPPPIDARTLGADCDNCPLKGSRPVPPSTNHNATYILCGEAPGKNEVEDGHPFVGRSGFYLNAALRRLGVDRQHECHVTNGLLCLPPKKFKPAQWQQALKCCRPRLEAEVSKVKGSLILAMGGKACYTLTDPTGPFNKPSSRDKITSWRGAFLDSQFANRKFEVMPTLHPAFVLRAPHNGPVFDNDLKRLVSRAGKQLPDWKWPEIHVKPGPAMVAALKRVLASTEPIGVDIENIGDAMAQAKIRCIGVAIKDLAVSVPIELNCTEEAILLGQILASNNMKVYHNFQHDVLAMKRWNINVAGPIFDTMLAHAVVAPLLAHDLGFVASMFFHAPRWKTENKVDAEDRGLALFEKKPIEDLCIYNAKDAWMQRILMEPLEAML